MSDIKKRGTFIHGIGASEHLDSSGERIVVEGIDITSLIGDGCFNYEHKSEEASQIVGKILEAKKILKRSDCENESHEYFWDKVKMPYLYIAGELFDAVDHSGAKDNMFNVLNSAFEAGSTFNLHLEDDFLLAPDTVDLANWYYENFKSKPTTYIS